MSFGRRGAWALVLVLACVAARGLVRAQQCRRVAASVAVGTSRNASGHWEAQVVLQRRSEAPGRGAGEVRLEVEPSTAICGGARVDSVTLTIRGPPPPPGPGYVSVPGVGYYRIHKELHTWAEAKAICEAEGGHLLIINSEAEDKAILQLLKRTPNLSTWLFIGFDDKEKEGFYVTIFGDPVASLGYARWHPGQPDDWDKKEDCGTVWTESGGLNDYICDGKMGFICEQRTG
ncbi:hypothetical protein R5R35_007428 [Gryllus longicercus]|uniref:C-type lectin domain-containing protein n=1 Tax=Gryllus longicercus TaxID=2509291 RepID=A0AAN9V1U2_9ORTH